MHAFRALLLATAFSTPLHAQESLPKPVAEIAVNFHLATLLDQKCDEISLSQNFAVDELRKTLSKEKGMALSQNSYSSLLSRIGQNLLFAAEQVYFEQMEISHFDRGSFCRAAAKAIEDQQVVGSFLRVDKKCKKNRVACRYF